MHVVVVSSGRSRHPGSGPRMQSGYGEPRERKVRLQGGGKGDSNARLPAS